MRFIKADEVAGELLLESVRQEQDRHRGLNASKTLRRRQPFEVAKEMPSQMGSRAEHVK